MPPIFFPEVIYLHQSAPDSWSVLFGAGDRREVVADDETLERAFAFANSLRMQGGTPIVLSLLPPVGPVVAIAEKT